MQILSAIAFVVVSSEPFVTPADLFQKKDDQLAARKLGKTRCKDRVVRIGRS